MCDPAWKRPPARRSLAAALLISLVVQMGAGGCAPESERLPRGVMAVMETEQTALFQRNFNPLLEAGAMRWAAKRAMYEPMLIHNPVSGHYVPWLAESYRFSDDRLQLFFQLRSGVTWSDGATFDADDVVFTFNLLRRFPALDARALWARLVEVQAADARTVVVTFKRPHTPSFEEIAQQAIVPAHIWGRVADPVSFANPEPVATGPFTEIRFFGAQAYEVGRNPRYWQGPPALEALRFRAYPANEQAILALLHGELDWAGSFLPAIERVFKARDPTHHVYWFPLLDATVFLYPNTTRWPLSKPEVRKAISMAIDRERIVRIAMHGYTRPADATGLSDAYAAYRDPRAVEVGKPWVSHDPEGARRLLEKAGLARGKNGRLRTPDGRKLVLTLEVPAGFSDWIGAAQMTERDLEEVGLEVRVRTLEYQVWFERLQTGQFELSMAWSDLLTTPYGFYRSLLAEATLRPVGEAAAENWHRFGLPEADALLAQIEQTLDPDRQRSLFARLQMLFVLHAPVIPLFPGPLWGECNTRRIVGFPSAQDPYAPLSPNLDGPQPLLVLTRLKPR